jgi:hypothetical protein
VKRLIPLLAIGGVVLGILVARRSGDEDAS